MVQFDDIDWGQRRRYVRRPVRLRARVQARGRELPAITENISPGGVFLCMDLPADVDVVVARLDLPNGKEMLVRGRVCWRREAPVAGVGINFEQFLHDPGAEGGEPLGKVLG